ncbi:MAG: carbohydrate binding domain-containing protein [Thermoguttaceae bacterium]|nr:carbohydrate binding domain-containing protein [Thermoguttaceae bacterium]
MQSSLARLFGSLALFVAVCSAPALATNYYVDSRAGSDSADGKTPETAWKTLDRVSRAEELEPGDSVLFKAGEVWRENFKPRSGSEGKPIRYGSYGKGAKPSFWGSVSLAKESDWSKVGENLWATRATEIRKLSDVDLSDSNAFLGGGAWGLHQESGAKVAQKVETASDGSKTYRFDCEKTGTARNHIQWCKGVFPIKKGTCYRLSFDMKASQEFGFGVSLMKSGAPWTGYGDAVVSQTRATTETTRGTILFKANRDADDARVTFYLGGAPEGVSVEFGNFAVEIVEIDALDLAPDVGNIILNGSKAAFKRWTLDDLKSQDDFCYERGEGRVWYYSKENPAKVYDSLEAAVMKHVIDHSGLSDAVFEGLDLRYGAAHGFGGSGCSRLVIRDCDISWIGGGDQYRGGGDGRRVRFGNGIEFWASASDCFVENCKLWEVYDAALTNQGSGTNVERNIVYRGNTIWNCEYSFEYWNRDEESITENVLFENNACLNAGYGWGHAQRPDPNGCCLMFYSNTAQTKNFMVRNNVFANATESLVRSDVEWTPEGPQMNGNVYWQENKELPYALWLRKPYGEQEFDDYRAASGQESGAKIKRVDVDAILAKIKAKP